MDDIKKAFVLGAGLGTRLKSLTEHLPKPLIPVWNKPLLTYAFDHLIADAGVEQFMVNTHHCPGRYNEEFADGTYRERSLSFRHEPVLLETAGGIANIIDWLPNAPDESFIVYNGDILTDMPLKGAIDFHQESRNLVTMILRSKGDALQVALDQESGNVIDIRNYLETHSSSLFQFTGVYLVRSEFLSYLTPGKKESVVLPFLEVIRKTGKIGGYVIDEGIWSDLGTRGAYLRGSNEAGEATFPLYGRSEDQMRIHIDAEISEAAHIGPNSSVGAGASIGAGARLDNSIIWPGGIVAPSASLRNCIVRSGQTAEGILVDADV